MGYIDNLQSPRLPSDPSTSRGADTNNCSFSEKLAKYKVLSLHQSVRLYDVDFGNKSFRIHTDIQILPMQTKIKDIVMHIGEYCFLPNEQGDNHFGTVTLDGVPCKYRRKRLDFKLDNHINSMNLTSLKKSSSDALAKFEGELFIEVPHDVQHKMQERKVIVLSIDCLVKCPAYGIYFANGGKRGDGAHVYTYRSGLMSSTKDWLPCFDAPDQLNLWRLQFDVPFKWTALSSGELVEVEALSDESLKTYVYVLGTPTPASNIGWAIGDFEDTIQPEMPDVSSYSPPGVQSLVKHTLATLPRVFTFIEETLSCRFPYASYKMVFVDQPPEESQSYAGITMFNINLLYHKKILDTVQSVRQVVGLAVASQFFGCFVNARCLEDLWVVKSLAMHLTALYVEKTFGSSEYHYLVNKLMEQICDYETSFGPIILQPKSPQQQNHLYFNPSYPETCSPHYAEARYKKGQFVMRCLQLKLGKEHFLKVLNRMLVVANQFSQNLDKPAEWSHMIVSCESFFRTVISVTGRELSYFMDLFVYNGGHANFDVNFQHNRKRNIVELELKQDVRSGSKGKIEYVGPLTISIQELDGCFTHTVQIDANTSKHDLQCHSKGRRQKRKKVPLSTGEELDIDLSALDADSPVMWIRIDPQIELPRTLKIAQPQNQWEYMLRYERCVIAQTMAIEALQHFPLQNTHNVLVEAINNPKFFHRVRSRAALCLTEVSNRLPDGLISGKPALIDFFEKNFGCSANPSIPALHNFVATSSNLQRYILMSSLPPAIGRMRRELKHCPREITRFLLGLLQFNDNSINRYSDDHYRSALIGGLTSSITQAERSLGEAGRPEALNEDIDEMIMEITRALNMDQLEPSYHKVVSQACLKCILALQRFNHLPLDPEVFWTFAESKSVFNGLRKTALMCLCSMIRRTHNPQLMPTINKLFDLLVKDESPFIRHGLATLILPKTPFAYSADVINNLSYFSNTKDMATKLWKLATDMTLEPKIRVQLVDIYYMMYLIYTPLVLRPKHEIEDLQRRQHEEMKMGGGPSLIT
ncbi:unnamed protein product [Bursaphelenchus xylophilus]|uniref:Transcription initiation factor TFIID subunit 2 n=1 Tax=Bursaphelenchus xylophilus TaxID=6326 RepID=A0A1I7S4F1_BURXY|nr:unnamed protein product [Bursaphelenchus xylophilus]CAG9117027.1 unnamed protein product [Bursaphelenchus xylophilus]